MSTEHPTKPDYLGLLNAISLAESRAGRYLRAWADVTPSPDLRQALGFVAARETTHGEVFRQRIERLGFSLVEKEDPAFVERLRVLGDPTLSDVEKIRRRRSEVSDSATDSFFTSIDERAVDPSVDQLTRDTLRWYVHEERDSRALLRAAYERVAGGDGGERGRS